MKYFSTIPKTYGAVQWSGDNIDELNELLPHGYRQFQNGTLMVANGVWRAVHPGDWILFSPDHGIQLLERHPTQLNFCESALENPHAVQPQTSA